MGEFGFSTIGLAFLLAMLIPNLIWAFTAKPEDYDPSSENRVLRLFERVGQAAVTTSALLFSSTDLRPWDESGWDGWNGWLNAALIAAIVLIVLYEVAWVRYFVGPHTMESFTRKYLGIPVPLAVLPLAAFLLLGVYGQSVWLVSAVVILIHINIR